MLDKGFPTLKSNHFWYFDNECLTFFLNTEVSQVNKYQLACL